MGSVAHAHGDEAGPCERLDVVGDNPGVVRVSDHRGRHRRGRQTLDQRALCEVDGRVGETVPGVDDGGRVGEADRLGDGVTVDLAAARLPRVGRDSRRAVPFLAVGLGRGECPGDPLRVVRGGVVRDQDVGDERAQIVEPDPLFIRHGSSRIRVEGRRDCASDRPGVSRTSAAGRVLRDARTPRGDATGPAEEALSSLRPPARRSHPAPHFPPSAHRLITVLTMSESFEDTARTPVPHPLLTGTGVKSNSSYPRIASTPPNLSISAA